MSENRLHFEWKDALQMRCQKQIFWMRLLRKRVWIGVIVLIGVILACESMGAPVNTVAHWAEAELVIFAFLWIFSYFYLLVLARQLQAMLEHDRVTVELGSETLTIENAMGIRRLLWSRLNSLKETPDFLLLGRGPLILVYLPKQDLPPEALNLIRKQLQPPAESQDSGPNIIGFK